MRSAQLLQPLQAATARPKCSYNVAGSTIFTGIEDFCDGDVDDVCRGAAVPIRTGLRVLVGVRVRGTLAQCPSCDVALGMLSVLLPKLELPVNTEAQKGLPWLLLGMPADADMVLRRPLLLLLLLVT